MSFTTEQQALIDNGSTLAQSLTERAMAALAVKKSKNETKRHHYIFSPPGAGKTFTVAALAEKHNVKLVKIQGAPSMNFFVTTIALAVYLNPNTPFTVWIDDSDSLFTDADALNVMKGALDEDVNMLSWSKNLTMQINQYESSEDEADQLRARALRHFQSAVGVAIPTKNIRFIITSNKKLCAPTLAAKPKQMHEAAVRDRVKYVEFNVTGEEAWGWMASVVINNKIMNMSAAKRALVLDWMYSNWSRLPATSIRAFKEYAEILLDSPKSYQIEWSLMLKPKA